MQMMDIWGIEGWSSLRKVVVEELLQFLVERRAMSCRVVKLLPATVQTLGMSEFVENGLVNNIAFERNQTTTTKQDASVRIIVQ